MEPHSPICLGGGARIVGGHFCLYVKGHVTVDRQWTILHTSLIRHEIFRLVFAVVEAAGQNHVVIVALKKK